ncbi:hypothetical protein [Thalassospira sp. TSL5-1]|uniref:hypothetical protein n=1 Tax=Thalassospira sp. TSL5-1 TaxID=1544451 RepID=UPI00093C7D7A|nr:hypothetical protein [Thalassospira sp. TSL5-1]OKH87642.1 hypothetical protein LF95_12840 [Thalassospira sp. TSL5-1]
MYQPRTPGYTKKDPVKRWNLPDRVFFACGACHILAHAFLARFDANGDRGYSPLWFKPAAGFTGNHIVIAGYDWIFDYHGYSPRDAYLRHTWHRARQRWPGWHADLVTLPRGVLLSEEKSREIDGLWLRGPDQFLHKALPRANRFLTRFGPPPA